MAPAEDPRGENIVSWLSKRQLKLRDRSENRLSAAAFAE
jgi:hypothetical protein